MALILVAEDTPEVAALIKDILESRGHQVAMAGDGVRMIEQAMSLRPQLIVSDIMMPGAYGSSAYKSLQDDKYTKDIPVIFLTALTPEQAAKVVPPSDKVTILHKPVDIFKLLSTVEQFLPKAV